MQRDILSKLFHTCKCKVLNFSISKFFSDKFYLNKYPDMNSCETPYVWKFETIQDLQNNYLNYHLKTFIIENSNISKVCKKILIR